MASGDFGLVVPHNPSREFPPLPPWYKVCLCNNEQSKTVFGVKGVKLPYRGPETASPGYTDFFRNLLRAKGL